MNYQFVPRSVSWKDIVFPWMKVGRTINMGVRAVRSYIAGDSAQGWEYTKAAGEAYLHSIPGMVVIGSTIGSKTLGTLFASFSTSFFKMTPTIAKAYTVISKGATAAFRTIGKVWVWPAKKSVVLAGRMFGRSVSTAWKAMLIKSPSLAKLVTGVTTFWKSAATIGVRAVSFVKTSAIFIAKGAAATATKVAATVASGFAAVGTKIAAIGSSIAAGIASVPVIGWIIVGAVVIATATIALGVTLGLKYRDKQPITFRKDKPANQFQPNSNEFKYAGGN